MSDRLLAGSDQEEALSIAYVQAIAAGAGYVTAKRDFDRDGVDIEIKAGGEMRPCLEVQLKASINLDEPVEGQFKFPLKRRNYDLLRLPTMTPRILVVLSLPRDDREWLHVAADKLIMRRCAFWQTLRSAPETENKASVTISIPQNNVFDVDGLQALMAQARKGVIA